MGWTECRYCRRCAKYTNVQEKIEKVPDGDRLLTRSCENCGQFISNSLLPPEDIWSPTD